MTNSMDGYIGEIGMPHCRHLPRRRSQLRTGTLSYGLIGEPHSGQRDCSDTMDSPAGIRRIQTFRKLPISSPNMKNPARITCLL